MVLDAKRAPGDTALNDATAKENIDPVEVRAQDYSGAIQQEQQRADIAPDIFVPLIDMEEKGLEVNEAEKEAQFAVDFNKDNLNDQDYKNAYETLTKSNIVNSVYETSLRMKDQWAIKQIDAQQNGYEESSAFNKLMQEYTPEKLFPDSQMAREIWDTNYYKPFYEQTSSETIQSDLKTAQAKSLNALATSTSMAVSNVYNGAKSDKAFSNWLKETAPHRSMLSSTDNQKAIDEAYSMLKLSEAKRLRDVSNPSNYTATANSLAGILKQNGKKKYQALDNNGKPLKDPQTGKNVEVRLSMTPEAISQVSSMISSLRDAARAEARGGGGGVGGGVSGASGYAREYLNAAYDYNKIVKGGYSAKLNGLTVEGVQSDFAKQKQMIMNAPISDRQKARLTNEFNKAESVVIGAVQMHHGLSKATNADEFNKMVSRGYEALDQIRRGSLKLLKDDKQGLLGGFKNLAKVKAAEAGMKLLRSIRTGDTATNSYLYNHKIHNAEDQVLNYVRTGDFSDRGKRTLFSLAQGLFNMKSAWAGTENDAGAGNFSAQTWSEFSSIYNAKSGKDRANFVNLLAEMYIKTDNELIVPVKKEGEYEDTATKQARELKEEVSKTIMTMRAGSSSYLAKKENFKQKGIGDADIETQANNNIGQTDSTSQGQMTRKNATEYMNQVANKLGVDTVKYGATLARAAVDIYNVDVASDGNDKNVKRDIEHLAKNFFVTDIKYSKYAIPVNSAVFKNKGATLDEAISNVKEEYRIKGDRALEAYRSQGGKGKILFDLDTNGNQTMYIDGNIALIHNPETGKDEPVTIINYGMLMDSKQIPREEQLRLEGERTAAIASSYVMATNQTANMSLAKKHDGFKAFLGDKRGVAAFGDKNAGEYVRENAEQMRIAGIRTYYALQDPSFASLAIACYADNGTKYQVEGMSSAAPFALAGDKGDNFYLKLAYAASSCNNKVNTVQNVALEESVSRGDMAYTDLTTQLSGKGFEVHRERRPWSLFKPNNFKLIMNPANNRDSLDMFGRYTDESLNKLKNIALSNKDSGVQIVVRNKELYNRLSDINDKAGRNLVIDASPKAKVLDPKSNVIEITSSVPVDVKPKDKLSLALSPMARDCFDTQSRYLPQAKEENIEAMLYATTRDVKPKRGENPFGIANLTPDMYRAYGLDDKQMLSPVMQARVATQRYQQLVRATGDEYKAMYLLLGGSAKISATAYSLKPMSLEKSVYSADDLLTKEIEPDMLGLAYDAKINKRLSAYRDYKKQRGI